MRIVLDAMGSDTCPEPEVAAAVEAARLFGEEIILVGPVEELKNSPAIALVHPADQSAWSMRPIPSPWLIKVWLWH